MKIVDMLDREYEKGDYLIWVPFNMSRGPGSLSIGKVENVIVNKSKDHSEFIARLEIVIFKSKDQKYKRWVGSITRAEAAQDTIKIDSETFDNIFLLEFKTT